MKFYLKGMSISGILERLGGVGEFDCLWFIREFLKFFRNFLVFRTKGIFTRSPQSAGFNDLTLIRFICSNSYL